MSAVCGLVNIVERAVDLEIYAIGPRICGLWKGKGKIALMLN